MDILVANEYSIQSLKMGSMMSEDQFTVTQYVPDPSQQEVPCALSGNGTNYKVSHQISSSDSVSSQYTYIVH